MEQGWICVPETKFPRIVVVGGGFAGLNFIKKLKNKSFQVVLIDKNNFHQFMPLLYQVASSGLEPDNIVFPYRKLFWNYQNVVFRMAEAVRVDAGNSLLHTTIGTIYYDYLVIASGSETNYFGNRYFERYGLGLKTVTDALDIRSRLLQNLEKASITCVQSEKQKLSTVVIVGGGASGVEVAGALAEFKKYVLPKDYPELKNAEMKIILVEAGNRLLPALSDKLSSKTLDYLEGMNVMILLDTMVNSYDGSVVGFDKSAKIETKNFIWTAGIKGNSLQGLPNESRNSQNRLLVDKFNRIKSLDNIFAIGDNAMMITNDNPNGHPLVAQPAIQQGKLLAKNLLRMVSGRPMKPFQYNNKGAMATIGRKKAVAEIGNYSFGGIVAWLIWSFVHLASLIGFRNKILVAINWAWRYFTYDNGDRVIIRRFEDVQHEFRLIKDEN